MKKYPKFLTISAILAIICLIFASASNADAVVRVRGYLRKDGTYVQPHYRSDPNGNPYDNWSFPGNVNPFTGKIAPGNPDTYLQNYYNNSSSVFTNTPTISVPLTSSTQYNNVGSSNNSTYDVQRIQEMQIQIQKILDIIDQLQQMLLQSNQVQTNVLTETKSLNYTFVPHLSSSANHTCVAITPSNVKCWGYNDSGQLGNGQKSDIPVHSAVSVLDINDVQKIVAGGSGTCALLNDSSVECWGYAYPVSRDSYRYYTSPTHIFNLTGVKDISIGISHICVLMNDNTVRCWGNNEEGEVGDGTYDYKTEPTIVQNLSNPISITSGYMHTCALLNDKTVKCWGDNTVGQLGNDTANSSNVPVQIQNLSDVKSISAGGWHTCALLNNGAVKCWGFNNAGQLGDGTTNNKSTPVLVKGLENDKIIKIIAGGFRSCALLDNETVKCWGEGYSKNGITVDFAFQAELVQNLSGVKDVAVGMQHTCALLKDSTVRCWGLNSYGQIGDGSYAYYVISPTIVTGL